MVPPTIAHRCRCSRWCTDSTVILLFAILSFAYSEMKSKLKRQNNNIAERLKRPRWWNTETQGIHHLICRITGQRQKFQWWIQWYEIEGDRMFSPESMSQSRTYGYKNIYNNSETKPQAFVDNNTCLRRSWNIRAGNFVKGIVFIENSQIHTNGLAFYFNEDSVFLPWFQGSFRSARRLLAGDHLFTAPCCN